VHNLSVKNSVSPKTQPQWCFNPKLIPEIEKEMNRLIDVGFVCQVKYLTWIVNIMPMRKKNDQLYICVDFGTSMMHAQKMM